MALQDKLEVLFGCAVVSHLEVDLGEAEVSLVVFVVVAQTLFVLLQGLLVPLMHVLYLAKNEVELAPQDLDFLPESRQLSSLWLVLALQDLKTDLGELLGLIVLLYQKEVFRQVPEAQWVSRVGIERSLEVFACLLAALEIGHVGCDLNDAEGCERHRVLRVVGHCLVHAQLGLG